MAILNYESIFVGEIGVKPRLARLICNDTYATITSAGYIGLTSLQGNPLSPSDFVFVSYGADSNTSAIFNPSISNGIVTLVSLPINPGNVSLPVTANHMAVFTDTTGKIGDDAATAINGGNIQAGLSGTAGYVASFPSTAAKGSLRVTAVANTGNTLTTLSNAAMGQATVVTIPDPGTATANLAIAPAALVNGNLVSASGTAGRVADSGVAVTNVQLKNSIYANFSSVYGGGSTSTTFVLTGLTSSALITGNIIASTNSVSITKITPTSNTITVTFSADPGAGTQLAFHVFFAAQ